MKARIVLDVELGLYSFPELEAGPGVNAHDLLIDTLRDEVISNLEDQRIRVISSEVTEDKATALAERIKAWRENDKQGYTEAIELLHVAENLLLEAAAR